MSYFYDHIEELIEKEGGYKITNHPADRGGRTVAGISEKYNPHWPGWKLIDDEGNDPDSIHLINAINTLYKTNYWDTICGDKIKSDKIASTMFSCSVLSGPKNSIRMAQRVCNVTADGIMGPISLEAINNFPEKNFVMAYALGRIARFCGIVERDASQSVFLRGWIKRVLLELV